MLFLFLASLICLDASRVFKLHSFKSSHPSSQCSDGSPTGMYINQSSSGSASWIIFLEGGGWCYDEVTCKGRPSSLISSKGWPSVATYQGLLAPTSPELVDANAVFLRYCTNDAWVGSVESPFSDWKFSMLGRVYIDAVLQELVHSYGLGSTAGTKVMFSGCSAGARGAMFNSFFASQRLKTLISPPSNLLAFGSFFDSAWWMDVDPLSSNAVPFRTQVQDVYALTNAGAPGYLNPACMAAFPGADGWKCMMGEYAENYTQESFFSHTYQFDSFQLGEDIGHSPPDTPSEIAYANKFRESLRESANTTIFLPKRAGSSALFPACYHHCNTQGSTFYTALTNGVSLQDAVSSWSGGLPGGSGDKFIMEDCSGFACGQNCPA